MPSIGPLEIMVVAVVALVVFGPNRLPEMARQAGKAIAGFKEQMSDMKAEFDMGADHEGSEVDGDEHPETEDIEATTAPGSSQSESPATDQADHDEDDGFLMNLATLEADGDDSILRNVTFADGEGDDEVVTEAQATPLSEAANAAR